MARATHITIRVPGVLRAYAGGSTELPSSASNVRDALADLEQRHPSLHRHICDETGAVRRHVSVFVNNDHVRERDGLDTKLVVGDVVTILPAVSGG